MLRILRLVLIVLAAAAGSLPAFPAQSALAVAEAEKLAKAAAAGDRSALRQLEQAAAQGEARAQSSLGSLYVSGSGVPKDPARAVRLLLQAARGGDADGEFAYGLMRLDGYPEGRVRKIHDEAMRWLKKAAAKGHPRAQGLAAELELPLDFQLLRAIERGSKADALRALERGASVNAGDPLGRTALGYAAGSGQTDLVEDLLRRGANVNAASADGTTPLTAAARFGDPEIVRALLTKGADANAAEGSGETALGYAKARLGDAPAGRKNFAAVVRILTDAGARR